MKYSLLDSAGILQVDFQALTKGDDMFNKTRAFLSDERGQDLVEYSLLCAIIGAVVVAYLTGVGTSIQGILTKVSSSLDTIDRTLQ